MIDTMADRFETSSITMPNTTSWNGSEVRTNLTLAEVNDAMALTLLPAMLYIGLIMIVGFVGNSLVVYVFVFRFRQGTQNFLIICLAVFDLISCMIAMPTEIVDLRYFVMFDSLFACKLLTFVTSFCAMCSVFTLLGIAVDRYIKICRPLDNQVEIKHVRIWIVVVIFVSILFSWPSLVIYGIRSADTGVPNLIGRDCSTADEMKDTKYPLIYNLILAFGLLITTVILTVLYILILKAVNVHKRHMRARASICNSVSIAVIAKPNANDSETDQEQNENQQNVSNGHRVTISVSDEHDPHHRENSVVKKRSKRNRTTVIAFLVTVVFVLSFLPHLALMCTRSLVKDFDHDLRGGNLVAFNIFLRSYFINSVANPIIYGVLNYKFREECELLFKRVLCCRRRPVTITNFHSFSTWT